MSVSVCLRVSPRCPIFTVTDTLVLPLAVARSSSVATAIRRVLPVSFFPCSHGVSIPVQQRGCGVRLDDVLRRSPVLRAVRMPGAKSAIRHCLVRRAVMCSVVA